MNVIKQIEIKYFRSIYNVKIEDISDINILTGKNDVELRMKAENKNYTERSKTSLTRFLNRIQYYYVPAIKDRSIYSNMLMHLKDTIYNDKLFDDKSLSESLKQISNTVSKISEELSNEFKNATGVSTELITAQRI